MAITVTELVRGFAAEVAGVDCRGRQSPDDVAAIRRAIDAHAVLVFRDQRVSDEEQLAFTLQFGELEALDATAGSRFHFRTEAEARRLGRGMGDFSNVDGQGRPLATTSRAYMFKLADRLWHSDSSFNAVPATYSVLSGRAIPSWGGNTEFADMRAAWDALDARTRRQVEGLVSLHSQVHSRAKAGFDELSDAERVAFRPVRHRLVRTHPSTGRKSLFLSSHAGEIEGMSLPEARMLLLDLTEFATQPRFVYSHAWRLHDLLMWDNQATMHRGRPFDPAEPRDIRQTRLRCAEGTIEQHA